MKIKELAPSKMRTIDILYGRVMRGTNGQRGPVASLDHVASRYGETLATIEELARRCGTTQRGIVDLINQGEIVINTPFGIELKPKKVSENKIALSPTNNPAPTPRREKSSTTQIDWERKVKLETLPQNAKNFLNALNKLAFFPTQNLETVESNLSVAIQTNRPFRIDCFVCLVNEWIVVDGRPVYRVCEDPTRLTRLEQPRFIERSSKIFKELDETGMPYQWRFVIADTDAWDLFDDWADPNQDRKVVVKNFEQRIASKLCLSPSVETRLWSEIQEPFNAEYRDIFNKVLRGEIQIPNLEEKIKERYEYYKKFYKEYFASRGMKVSEEWIEVLATLPPKRNFALYAAQGPVNRKTSDAVAIGDRDALRCGRNQSVLAKNLGLIYPYPGD